MEGLPPVDFRAELNDEQYAAVTSPRGPALVLAGAGSGKTRTLTYRVAWLLHQGAKPWDILLLTFTNKSAKEMLERVEDLTGVPRGQFWGGTFHSIGQRILRRNAQVAARSPDFTILDQKESEQLFSEIVKSIDGAFIKDKTNPKAAVVLDAYSHARNTLRPLQDVLAERLDWMKGGPEKLMQFCASYEAAKKERNLCDFDDLLSLWLHVLENDPAALAHYRQRFRHILVDEFQDTNRLQSRIIDLLASEHQIMAVGDDAQCIYTWRGADWENIVAFPNRHPGTLIHTIDTNYRSTPEILAFANEILSHRPRIEGFDLMASLSDAPIIIIEGDEYLASPIDRQAKFLLYQPHIALISGIAWDHINVYPTFESYTESFSKLIRQMPKAGHLFFDQTDSTLEALSEACPEHCDKEGYEAHPSYIQHGKTWLKGMDGKDYEIRVFGEHTLKNLNGARLICEQIGLSSTEFYEAIRSFKGAAKRLELVGQNDHSLLYKDFAHAPSKVEATTRALKSQFPERQLIACLELHTFSSLNPAFLPQYEGTLAKADQAIVYLSEHARAIKRMERMEESDRKSVV